MKFMFKLCFQFLFMFSQWEGKPYFVSYATKIRHCLQFRALLVFLCTREILTAQKRKYITKELKNIFCDWNLQIQEAVCPK